MKRYTFALIFCLFVVCLVSIVFGSPLNTRDGFDGKDETSVTKNTNPVRIADKFEKRLKKGQRNDMNDRRKQYIKRSRLLLNPYIDLPKEYWTTRPQNKFEAFRGYHPNSDPSYAIPPEVFQLQEMVEIDGHLVRIIPQKKDHLTVMSEIVDRKKDSRISGIQIEISQHESVQNGQNEVKHLNISQNKDFGASGIQSFKSDLAPNKREYEYQGGRIADSKNSNKLSTEQSEKFDDYFDSDYVNYSGHPDAEYNGHPDDEYNGHPDDEYNGHPDDEYNGHPDDEYNGHPDDEYNGHPDDEYNGHPDDEYNGHPDDEYNGHPDVQSGERQANEYFDYYDAVSDEIDPRRVRRDLKSVDFTGHNEKETTHNSSKKDLKRKCDLDNTPTENFEVSVEKNKTGRILDIFTRTNSTFECTTPKNESGQCRSFSECPIRSIVDNYNMFLQYMCLRGVLVGVCCPDNPVIEITDLDEENVTEKVTKDIEQPPGGCGLSHNTRIVGGSITVPHEWTWMVALTRRNRFFCGGVIINNWYILTAAHCVMGVKVKDLKVRLGEYNFFEKNEHQQDIPVAEIKRHALFVTLTFQHDIALLKLKRRIEYSKFIGSICLPERNGRNYSDAKATVVGWGTVSFGGAASPVLRQVSIPVWENEDCDRTYFLENINDSFLCAGSPENGEDACQGDSGGPLMTLNSQSRWEVIGIVSWGRRCGDPTYPGVYTRVTSYLDWIATHAQ